MSRVRPPAVAGLFYPAHAEELAGTVRSMLDAAPAPGDQPAPKAIVAPHAGYVYSGPIAATAYARIRPLRGTIRRVVLLGPAHRFPVHGLALSSADAFATPLGEVPVDREACAAIEQLPQVRVFDATHRDEHGLEVHLPFLQETLGAFAIVPLVVGDATPRQVADVLDVLWDGPETLIVVSSDLSHYLDYHTATNRDRATCDAIERLDLEDISAYDACGHAPLCGLLLAAKEHGLKVETLDLRNSGDTAGDRQSVVGYGAWAFVRAADSTAEAHH
jgi:AmmeMemoRadiSam system protein B